MKNASSMEPSCLRLGYSLLCFQIKYLFNWKQIHNKNIPADCFPRVSLHDFIKKHLLWTTEKRANSHGFVTLQFQKFSKLCTIPMGRKKKALTHCYLQGIVTYWYFLGPQNGVRFLRCCSFRCGIGYIFVALFVKSSFGTFLLWSCTSQGMRHFQTSIAIDDNTSWSQHWGVLRFCCWHCLECVPSAFSIHSLWNQCAQLHYRFGYVLSMSRSSPFRSTLKTSYITGLDMC